MTNTRGINKSVPLLRNQHGKLGKFGEIRHKKDNTELIYKVKNYKQCREQKMKLGYIYKITNVVNGKVYIGQTIRSLKARFCKHVHDNGCVFLHNAIMKYGKENFIIEEIEQDPIKNLDEREIYWIAYYNSTNREKGYNILKGGKLGRTDLCSLSSEQIAQLIEMDKQNIPHTQICKKFNIERKTVTTILRKYSNYTKKYKTLSERTDIDEIVSAIVNDHLTSKQIRQKFKISQAVLFRLTKMKNIHFLTYRQRQKLNIS